MEYTVYFCIINTNDVDYSRYSLLGKGGGFHLDFQNVPFNFQSFLRYLLQEAAVEPCESIDRKEYLERDRGVLQTYGWAMCLACVELWICMDGGNQVCVFYRLCVLKTELCVVFSSVGADVAFPSTCSLSDWLPDCIWAWSVAPGLAGWPHSLILTENELLQNEVLTVTTGEAAVSGSKSPPSLRRRKRTCSRRQGEKEKEREVGGMGSGERADRGVREQRDRREASKSAWKQLCCCVYTASPYIYQVQALFCI